ncbi:hypothetical protein [Dethiobacter alkaliphilus]|uniref:Uncharacterized protein n=1 Tax=Dethiobacter alkaliphilus AHT 1 TaxID=555088 RepID=C0GDG2_DETAL|nr:hypothetical protein [Dethiobacter alkaliphilus]EEG78683.1 hypothetical protein DealDRAFT_0613 [Dethiobacter alkaliphilus AHT 1]
MDKKTTQFLIFSLVVMVLFGFLVRGVILAPKQAVAGPVLESHDLGPRYEDTCDVCHRNEIEFHEDLFGYFDDCMLCHGGEIVTPHGTTGNFEYCLGCHDDIVPSHDEMFPFDDASYEADCLGCHPAN